MPAVKRSRSKPGGGPARKKTKYYVASTRSNALALDHKLLRTTQYVTLRYATRFLMDPGAAGTAATYNFAANGMYDPDITGVGHQPRGFDQVMALYDHYIVEEACMEVWASPSDLNNAIFLTLGVRDQVNTSVDFKDHIENRVSTCRSVSGTQGGRTPGYLKLSVKPSEFLGLGKTDAELRGNIASNAGDLVAFNLAAFPLSGGVDSNAVQCIVKITYKARLMEPKEPVSS